MSLFGKLLGRKPFDALKGEAEALQAAGELGPAKLAFERARDARDAPPEARAAMRAAADACCDGLAEARLQEAEKLFEGGHADLAFAELEHALETAASQPLRDRVQAAMEAAQGAEYRADLDTQAADELDDDARYETLTGHFEMARHAEYAGYGEAMRQAVLQLNDGAAEAARASLEALVAQADDPCFLWFELGRARLAVGDDAGAVTALETFLARLDPDDAGDALLSARVTLAALAAERDDVEAAMGQYQLALEAMPEDPRTYLAMGSFLRLQGMAEEAVDVLDSGIAVLEEGDNNFRLWLECGLANAAAGNPDRAIQWLERVVDLFATRRAAVPTEAAVTLAQLHEAKGNLTRAADLYRVLADGPDVANLLTFHREAARLLVALGAAEEARRMLVRARETVDDKDAEGRAALEAELAALPR